MSAQSNKCHILLLNGPNLNLLGLRESELYGDLSLEKLVEGLKEKAKTIGITLSHLQSNSEHLLIEKIHQSYNKVDFILINPAAFTHTSVALRDALLAVKIPFIEIHLSNLYAREPFRHHSCFSDIAVGVICGLGADSYHCALQAAANRLSASLCHKIPQQSIK